MVEVSIEAQVTDRPSIELSADIFQFIDQFHRPILWRTGKCPSRKGICDQLKGIGSIRQLPSHFGHQVYHMGVVLNLFENLHIH